VSVMANREGEEGEKGGGGGKKTFRKKAFRGFFEKGKREMRKQSIRMSQQCGAREGGNAIDLFKKARARGHLGGGRNKSKC